MTLNEILKLVIVAVAGYLLGSFPSGVIAAHIFGWGDPRAHGSGHTGGLNSYRQGGIAALLIVAFVDMLKGMAAIWLAGQLSESPWAIAIGGFAAVAGHNWPVWLGFKGGMGLATTAGGSLLLAPLGVLITGIVWLILRPIIKHSPRTTIVSCITVPVTLLILRAELPILIAISGMAAIIVLRTAGDWNRVYEEDETA